MLAAEQKKLDTAKSNLSKLSDAFEDEKHQAEQEINELSEQEKQKQQE